MVFSAGGYPLIWRTCSLLKKEQYRESQGVQQGECIQTMLPQAQNVSCEGTGMISYVLCREGWEEINTFCKELIIFYRRICFIILGDFDFLNRGTLDKLLTEAV